MIFSPFQSLHLEEYKKVKFHISQRALRGTQFRIQGWCQMKWNHQVRATEVVACVYSEMKNFAWKTDESFVQM